MGGTECCHHISTHAHSPKKTERDLLQGECLTFVSCIMQCPVKFDSYDSLSLSLPSTFQVCFQFGLLNALFLVTCFDHPSQIINKICTLQVTFEIHEGYCLSWIIMCVKGLVDRLSQDLSLMLITTFRARTAGLHQAIVSISLVGLFVPTICTKLTWKE